VQTIVQYSFADPRRRPLRLLALTLALAIALLSSLLSFGLPRTTALGSAFNPSTTAVALQPTRSQVRQVVQAPRRDDGPASGHSVAIAIRSFFYAPAGLAASTKRVADRTQHALPPRLSLYDSRARAPPLT